MTGSDAVLPSADRRVHRGCSTLCSPWVRRRGWTTLARRSSWRPPRLRRVWKGSRGPTIWAVPPREKSPVSTRSLSRRRPMWSRLGILAGTRCVPSTPWASPRCSAGRSRSTASVESAAPSSVLRLSRGGSCASSRSKRSSWPGAVARSRPRGVLPGDALRLRGGSRRDPCVPVPGDGGGATGRGIGAR